MDDVLRARLRDLSLNARRLLTDETRSLLTAVYGLSPEGRFEQVERLPAVQNLPEVAETRQQLERWMRTETAAGRNRAEAVERLVRETAFTHLNRLVAFKLLETRRLIRGTIDRYHASNGFLFYLVDHPDDEARYQAGDMPQDYLGEGPRDVAYRHFLLWQSEQLAREVKVLFDANNLPSRLFPRPRALRELIEMLNAPELREAWTPGNEETIGWVYQYFNEEEKDAVFTRLNKQKQKIRREDLPAVTQLFTPRWIVRFLVENTLGRHWLQMHPDSRLAAKLEYLVPLAGAIPPVPLKPVRELALLDPACGTMHFGLVAFDLFAEMYREELDRAGEPGWPARPSVASADEIPAAILANNLFGIDIDLRAVQLAALSLYVRAKTLNPKATVTPCNLACADVTVLNGARLNAFIAAFYRRRPGLAPMLRALWAQLQHAGELGSLLRLEADLRTIAAGPRSQGQRMAGMAALPGMEEVEAGRFTAFSDLDAQVRAALNDFARREAARDEDATAFVAGVEEGFKLLGLLQRRYDVVVANPPYLDSRDFGVRLKQFLDGAYPEGKRNLFSAFMLRCQELLDDNGRLGMITPLSFMFLTSFEGLRAELRKRSAIEALVHTGYRTFTDVLIDCAFYTLRREANETRRQDSVGVYFRLVREPDAEAKRLAFERAVRLLNHRGIEGERNHRGTEAQRVFYYRQGDFDAIPGAPWVYWVTPGLRRLFVELPRLSTLSTVCIGMRTGDNVRFLRYWWEVGIERIDRRVRDKIEAKHSEKAWFPYMKGGEFRRWHGNQEYVVKWRFDGQEIKENTKHNYPSLGDNLGWKISNEQYYFRPGVTWTDLTQGRFSARLSPGGFIFDVSGSSAFPRDINFVLGIMNSRFAQYALKLINPTVHVQVGDLARLPIPTQTSAALNELVERAIALAKQESAEDETTYDFVAPPVWDVNHRGTEAQRDEGDDSESPSLAASVVNLSPAQRRAELAAIERAIDEEVFRLYGIEGEDRAAIEAELERNHRGTEAQSFEDGEEPERAEDDESSDSLSLGVSVVDDPATLARRWLSYALGVALGRFQPGVEGAIGRGRFSAEVAAQLRALAVADGMALIEPGHPDDLCARIERILELMIGEEVAHRLIAMATEGKPLAGYLTGEFYKEHVRQYRKRPVYWLLQSPRKTFSVLLFHERLTGDSLPLLLGNRYLQGRINALRGRLAELQGQITAAAPGRARKVAERERDEASELLADAEEFARLIRAVIERTNERGEVVGWRPEIDDGVLINLAPLYTLIPAWSAEPKKCWQALERGDYDWARTAMRYWPDRVLAKCKTNKSFAIAHGVDI